jgi:kynurenine formamidase
LLVARVPLVDLKFLDELAARDAGTSNRRHQSVAESREDSMTCQKIVASSKAIAIAALCTMVIAASPARAQSDLARAYRIIASKQLVDLTHSFSPTTPVWSGFGQAKFSPAADPQSKEPYTIPKDGFRATYYEMVGQYGTHVDPPAHFAGSGITMDLIPLKQMILPLIVLDNTPYQAEDPNHAFSVDDLRAWEKRHGRVPKGSFVAPFPAWAFETIKFVYEQRGVTATGHESLDTDITDKMDSETYILQKGHYQIEVMANLDKVPATGALIVVTWPKVKDGLGFPARAFAILP